MRKLFPHQIKALRYGLSVANPAWYMEMRLGKSKTVITWLLAINTQRVLIVAPKTVLLSWRDEFVSEGLWDSRIGFYSKKSTGCPDWVLINFEALKNSELLKLHWDAIVIDESTRIKNPKADITKLLIKHSRADHKALLSGLPNPESLWDLVPQMLFLDGSFLKCNSFWQFRNAYGYPAGFKWKLFRNVVPVFEYTVAERCFTLNKQQAGMKCPIVYEKRYIDATAAQKKLYRELDKDFKATVDEKEYSTLWYTVREVWYAQIAGGYFKGKVLSEGKVGELLDLVRGEFTNKPVVVWFRFVEELASARKKLEAAGIRCSELRGKVPFDKRREALQAFKKGISQVLLVQVQTGLFGLDLSNAAASIYYSCGYSHEHRRQSEERIIHPQKKSPALIIDLVCVGSTDEAILKAQKEKGANARRIFELYNIINRSR